MGFKPPEVLEDIHNDSPAGDVWALGTCIYLLLTDQFPYTDPLADSTQSRFHNPLVPPRRINPKVDATLEKIVTRCLAVDPAKRFRSAIDLNQTLQADAPAATPLMSEDVADNQIAQAMALAADVTMLDTAADLLEHALLAAPERAAELQYKLRLWRRGISG